MTFSARGTTMLAVALGVVLPTTLIGPAAWAASTVDQSQDGFEAVYTVSSGQSMAQTFTVGRTGAMDQVDVFIGENAGKTSDAVMTISVQGLDDSGAPDGTVLASGDVAAADVPQQTQAVDWFAVPFDSPVPVVQGERYAVVATSDVDPFTPFTWVNKANSTYTAGSLLLLDETDDPTVWEENTAQDLGFKTYVDPGPDADGDGFGAFQECDDTSDTVYPGATETYNDVDDDCDGTTDEGFSAWYADSDADGYGAGPATYATSQPAGLISDSTDCDDAEAGVYPGATETYNQVDDNCNGFVDEGVGAPGAPTIGSASSGARGGAVTATARWLTGAQGVPTTGYLVQARKLNAAGDVVARVNRTAGADAHALTVRLSKGRYKFRVAAVNDAGRSPWSGNSMIVRAR